LDCGLVVTDGSGVGCPTGADQGAAKWVLEPVSQVSPGQYLGGCLLKRLCRAQPTQMPNAVSRKSRVRQEPQSARGIQSGAANRPMLAQATRARPKPSHHASSFCGAPTHS